MLASHTSVKSARGSPSDTRGQYRWTRPTGSSGPSVERGKYVAVWQKGADGVWRILEDIWNVSPDRAA